MTFRASEVDMLELFVAALREHGMPKALPRHWID